MPGRLLRHHVRVLALPRPLPCKAWGKGTGEWVVETHGAQLGPSRCSASWVSAQYSWETEIWCGRMPPPWLYNPSPAKALAACPSPWQIKPQTEGKQYMAPGVSAGLIDPAVSACATSLPSLWPDPGSWATGRHLWAWERCRLFQGGFSRPQRDLSALSLWTAQSLAPSTSGPVSGRGSVMGCGAVLPGCRHVGDRWWLWSMGE